MTPADSVLVARCRDGDCDAFRDLVERYQTLVCSVAYGVTGDLATSEELAQDAFVTAWKSLGELREPERLKGWLCSIVRNLARNSRRRQQRDLLSIAQPLQAEQVSCMDEAEPYGATIAAEEAALLDRTLASLPQQYREPLILYYRQNQSAQCVAELLEISPELVRQRLSRGRAMLRSEIAAAVERGLRATAPGQAFASGVMAALPGLTATGPAATLSLANAKGLGAAGALSWGPLAGAVGGSLAGLLGGWYGVRSSLRAAQSQRERARLIRAAWTSLAIVAIFLSGLLGFVLWGIHLGAAAMPWLAVVMAAWIVGYALVLLSMILLINRQLAAIRRESGPSVAPITEADDEGGLPANKGQKPVCFESAVRFLGLPLISVQFSGGADSHWRRPAVGWIAIGDIACGILFAGGGIAVGGVAMGGVSLGLFALAGAALGAVAIGGAAIGLLAHGGAAMGGLAFGGVALGWRAAMGGVAVAGDFALGGVMHAEHAGDEISQAYFAAHPFFRASEFAAANSWLWLVVVSVMIGICLVFQNAIGKRIDLRRDEAPARDGSLASKPTGTE